MTLSNSESHEFAFYTDITRNVSLLKKLDTFEVPNKELYHRIIKVLRLRVDDAIILFNSTLNIRCTIHTIGKDKFSLRVEEILHNKRLTPQICWLVPLLKKEAFEDCLYTLTEMGIQEIQPVITRKSNQTAPYLESDRAKNIMITAAEQSKQFILPQIHTVEPLEKIVKSLELEDVGSKIFFDPTGLPFFDVITNLKQTNAAKIICAIGPEGDLTESEKQLFKANNFQFCKLTETVLRAKQAVAVASGIVRAMLL